MSVDSDFKPVVRKAAALLSANRVAETRHLIEQVEDEVERRDDRMRMKIQTEEYIRFFMEEGGAQQRIAARHAKCLWEKGKLDDAYDIIHVEIEEDLGWVYRKSEWERTPK